MLADEINRATPKTQSALLEAMGERQVSVDGITYELPEPFMVMATQNPIEYEGTFPLPEAQLDRFFMRVSLGYPDSAEEVAIMDRREQVDPIDELTAACGPSDIMKLQSAADSVYADELVKQYIVDLSNGTRDHDDATLGVSPRRVDQPDEGFQGDGHAARPRLRGPRRRQADRRAGDGPPRPADRIGAHARRPPGIGGRRGARLRTGAGLRGRPLMMPAHNLYSPGPCGQYAGRWPAGKRETR